MIESYISYLIRQPIVCTAVFITIIPIVLIFIRKAYINPVFLILLIYLLIKFSLDLIMFHYAANRSNNIIFESLIVLTRYTFLSSMFCFQLENKLFKRLITLTIITFIIFSIWDFFSINESILSSHDHKEFLYSTTVECLLMICWIMVYFYETIRSLKIPDLLSYPFFWLCSGMLIYYSSIVFLTPFFHYTFKWNGGMDLGFFIYVPSISESISMIFISIGIWFFSAKNYAK